MPILDRKLRRDLIDLIEPHLKTIPTRETLIDGALFDAPDLRKSIQLEGTTYQFVSHLVSRCDAYGDIPPGEPALVAILDEFRRFVGSKEETDTLIAEIIRRTKEQRHSNTDIIVSQVDIKDEIQPENHPKASQSEQWSRQKVVATLDVAEDAISEKRFRDAIQILEEVLSKNTSERMQPRLERSLDYAQQQMIEAEIYADYQLISRKLKSGINLELWCEELQNFQKDYPGYYIENDLLGLCKYNDLEASESEISEPKSPEKINTTLPLKTASPLNNPYKKLIDWIDIPAAQVDLTVYKGGTKSIKLDNYSLSKYPITNDQFAKFIEAGGYQIDRWWTGQGLIERNKGWFYERGWKYSNIAWTEPEHWRDPEWNGVNHPVMGISWYEAVAFCLWLSEMTGEQIMLPTQDQWQYAAQGNDRRAYPWGHEWDRTRCNNSVIEKRFFGLIREDSSERTSPITRYEGLGNSPFGVVDMTGNQGEWCVTDSSYREDTYINIPADKRVLSGSWYGSSTSKDLRCDQFLGVAPYRRSGGLRLCRSENAHQNF
ncbi:MAG: SUMF1/EgtB/PvdO family nonheme iron enzyme [Aggregatilineales bacterium]